ncbi:division/cell wall cluster transcriptional repressor MraZ [Lewinella sp. 4G2]|uniref:division/cell wall cluster transcriptional repressor MraZ n=1 Tax=Lewinella sp. 4G2 TaxID=1803372 RepID=UPI0007B45C95|nr:division/cell wall cluster transcriptional repressor MraZ [Lewinella sp. 4G2]OAV44774.1 division/cell wall cluster transcriptional repressor MraZ [Lewinella sp. 4G2]
MTTPYNLLGEYSVTLDAKGRLRLPSSLIKGLGDRDTLKMVVNRGLTNCLTIYPMDVWDTVRKPIDELNSFDRRADKLKRLFYRGATEVVPDSADRILLPKGLQTILKKNLEEGAKLKNLVLIGLNNKIEIWDESEYERMLEDEADEYGSLSEDLLGYSSREPLA